MTYEEACREIARTIGGWDEDGPIGPRDPLTYPTVARMAWDYAVSAIDHFGKPHDRPRVVCLCGSTRFRDAFEEANRSETLAGRIVLSVGVFLAPWNEKPALDELHKRKIDLSDEVLVLNVGGYIGESTRSEIAYAEARLKPVRYLEPIEAR